MKGLLKKAFDVEAFERIKIRIDSEDITLSDSYTLSLDLKELQRENEHPWGNFFLLFGLLGCYIIILYFCFFIFPVKSSSVIFTIFLSLVCIPGMGLLIRSINNYFIYRKQYHNQYTKLVEKLDRIQKELQTKDDAEQFALDLFLKKRGQDIYNHIEDYIQKEEDVEEYIKKKFLKEMRDELMQENKTGKPKTE